MASICEGIRLVRDVFLDEENEICHAAPKEKARNFRGDGETSGPLDEHGAQKRLGTKTREPALHQSNVALETRGGRTVLQRFARFDNESTARR